MLQFFMPKDPRFYVEETAWRISQNIFENLIPIELAHSVNVVEISQNHDLGCNPLRRRLSFFLPPKKSLKRIFAHELNLSSQELWRK